MLRGGLGPVRKFEQRVRMWGPQPLDLQLDAMVYNTFAVSVLGYLAQLEAPPAWVLETERGALRMAAKCPGMWATPDDLRRLREHFGLTRSSNSIRHLAVASKLGVRMWDPACRRDCYTEDVQKLKGLFFARRQRSTRRAWEGLFARSLILILESTKDLFEAKVCSIDRLREGTGGHKDRGDFDSKPDDDLTFGSSDYGFRLRWRQIRQPSVWRRKLSPTVSTRGVRTVLDSKSTVPYVQSEGQAGALAAC